MMFQVSFIWKGRTLCQRIYNEPEHLAALGKARQLRDQLAITMTRAGKKSDKKFKTITDGDIELRLAVYSPQIEMELT